MDNIESKGKTVDEAVFTGLIKMDKSIDEVNIEILDEGGSLFKSARVRLTVKDESDEPAAGFVEEPRRERRDERPRRERSDRPRRDDRNSDRPRRDDRSSDRPRRDDRPPKPRKPQIEVVVGEPQNEAEEFLQGVFSRMGIKVALQSETEEGVLKIDMAGNSMGMLIGRRGETLDALQYLTSLVLNNGKEDYTKVMLDTEDYREKREDTLKRLAARLAEKVERSGRRVVLEPMNPYERRILHSTLQDYGEVYTYSEGEDPYRSVVVALKGSEKEPVSRHGGGGNRNRRRR